MLPRLPWADAHGYLTAAAARLKHPMRSAGQLLHILGPSAATPPHVAAAPSSCSTCRSTNGSIDKACKLLSTFGAKNRLPIHLPLVKSYCVWRQSEGRRLWGAPITVQSPQFAFMAKHLVAGKLGRVSAQHTPHYGHEGPNWSAFFYEKGGGSMPDLAVYNLTTLTGLLGPAKYVSAMLSVVTPERTVRDKGQD